MAEQATEEATQVTHDEAVKKLGEMIKGIDIGMMTTEDEDGALRSRPMRLQQAESDNVLWFYSKANSGKSHEIKHNAQVGISFARPDKQNYVSVSGRAEIVRDQAKIDELWSPLHKAWFPDGKDDPQLTLIKVTVEKAEYWDSPTNPVVLVAGFLKTAVTGKASQMGENEKVNL